MNLIKDAIYDLSVRSGLPSHLIRNALVVLLAIPGMALYLCIPIQQKQLRQLASIAITMSIFVALFPLQGLVYILAVCLAVI